GKRDEVGSVGQLGVLVPDHCRLAPGDLLQRHRDVAVAVGSRKDDDGRFHAFSSRSMRKFSITVLASNLRHISSMSEMLVPSARSSSINWPARTSFTPPNPRPSRAWWIALPCGSRTPSFRVTKTRAFMALPRASG